MKIHYVVQRYGSEVIGGAEAATRNLARGVARDHEVKVFTTCAVDARTWRNELPAGLAQDDGVEVIRFPTDRERHRKFQSISTKLFTNPLSSLREQERWIKAQGPLSSGLIDAIKAQAHEPDLWVFYSYLYHPTIFGLPLVADRAVLHPALHEEPPATLRLIRTTVRAAAALSVQTPEEWELVLRLVGWTPGKTRLVGMGVEEGQGDVESFRSSHGIGQSPFLLYLGRVDSGKGTTDLAKMFIWYKQTHSGDLKLVIAGPVVHAPPPHPDIIVTGRLSDEARWAALEGCEVFVHPSPFESFGIALLEAWTKAKPAIVNGNCLVTAGHARRSKGGIAYRDAAGFVGALQALLETPDAAQAMGRNGRAYAEDHFWDRVLTRYIDFLGEVYEDVSTKTPATSAPS